MRIAVGAWVLGALVLIQPAPAQNLKTDTKQKSPGESSINTPSSVGGKRLDEWKKELASDDASRRATAILAVLEFGDDAASCVPLILQRLNDTDVSPRARALLALRTMSIDEKDVPAIVRGIATRLVPPTETQAIIRYEAALSLYRYIADGSPAIPSLIQATMDRSSWEIRHHAVALLWRIGVATNKDNTPDARITEALLAALRFEKTNKVKLEIIQGLGMMGRPSSGMLLSKVVSELSLCATHRNRPLAIWAYAGLVSMQDGQAADQALNTIAKFLKNEDLDTRIQAAAALGALQDKAKKKVPALLEMLSDKEPFAVQAAASALGGINDQSDSVISALIQLTDNKDSSVAGGGVIGLVRLKQNNARVLAVLDKMLEKKDLDRRLRFLVEDGIKELKKPTPKK
ncbi:MAG: HEAT repeat domain-containing protein [Gemmataceae bacterium]